MRRIIIMLFFSILLFGCNNDYEEKKGDTINIAYELTESDLVVDSYRSINAIEFTDITEMTLINRV